MHGIFTSFWHRFDVNITKRDRSGNHRVEENWVSLTAHASNENVPPDLKRRINLAHFDI